MRMQLLIGAVAQLGARLHGMQKVEGSSPSGSSKGEISVLVSTPRLCECAARPVTFSGPNFFVGFI